MKDKYGSAEDEDGFKVNLGSQPNDSPEFAKALKAVKAEVDKEHTEIGGVAIK